VLDAVGVQLDLNATNDDNNNGLDSLVPDQSEVIRFQDPQSVVVRVPEPITDDATNALNDIRARAQALPGIAQVGALVAFSNRGASFLTDTIVVSLLTSNVDIVDIAARHGLEITRQFAVLPHTYTLRSPAGSGYDLLHRCAAVAAEPGIRYAEPNLVTTTVNDIVIPRDFLFPQQWDHGIIDTPTAWQVLRTLNRTNTFGDPAITVGVVDNGIDAAHAALAGTLSDGTPKIAHAFDFGLMAVGASTPNPIGVSADHGHCCATASVGATDDGVGQAGVAGNCHLIAVRRGGDEIRYAEMYLWLSGLNPGSTDPTFPAQLADGADVVTSSFGFQGSIGSPISGLMQDTFDAITNQGRGGRGTVLFFSAGNETLDLDMTNRRPWSMYGRCYGVAAATLANDGTTEIKAHYSNFGSTIDFCAPSNDFEGPHNPNQAFGAFTATRGDTPTGDAFPGAAVTSTTLRVASAANATTITVASTAGAAINGSVLIGAVATPTARGRRITAINTTTQVITLDQALPVTFASGTAVAFAPFHYRSDFGGTSYATPVVAGVAALMLSANPQLSWQQTGQILRDTCVKIDPAQTDTVGRWHDIDGRTSSDPDYRGPSFSRWYGAGRIDAGGAVARAAWTVDLLTTSLQFIDVPEGEETWRAVRFDVHSLHTSTFTTTGMPAAPFAMPQGSTRSLSGTADYNTVQEIYLWVSYTGTTAGASASDSLTVRHEHSGQTWTIPITANTVGRKTACVMLVLDRSGSMNSPSGVGSSKRIDVLHYSAGILAEAVHEGDGVGVVGFDQDASPVLVPPIGPLAVPSLFDPTRSNVKSAISMFTVNPDGQTSIGDGVELGQNSIASVEGYDRKAVIVFTDGYENSTKWIADVAPSITDRTYAVAMGRAENIRPAALTTLTNDTGGYCVLTNELDNNSRFKLAKYFLQVLAGVKNDQIVLDPPVAVPLDATIDLPFHLAETDTVVDVLFLTQLPWLIEMTLVTPNGDVIDDAFVSGLSGRNYVQLGESVIYYRLTLPTPIGRGAHTGTWQARFHLDQRRLSTEKRLSGEQIKEIREFGLTGILLVHASSSLRMEVSTRQGSFEPGAKIILQAELTEYDVAVEGRAYVTAQIIDPWGGTSLLQLSELGGGVFEEAFEATGPGVWTVHFEAKGKTFRGTLFTREAVRTASVWEGGDQEEPTEGKEPVVQELPR
jgi:subtilisin family serine protease